MAKKFKRLLSAVLATILCVSSISLTTFAENDQASATSQSTKINKTATALNDKDQTDVTLSVPGKAQDYSSDIVLIIGNGPASQYDYMMETIKKMLIAADGTQTKIKLGLVGYADTTQDETVLELTEMKDTVPNNAVGDYRLELLSTPSGATEEEKAEIKAENDQRKAAYAEKVAIWETDETLKQDMEYIVSRALEECEKVYNGVNMESSLITARDMLMADTSVPANRKHMILISTGLTYWFDNDNGVPSFIVRNDASGNPQQVNYKYWLQHRNGTTSTSNGYCIPSAYKTESNTWTEAWNAYWNNIVSWIKKDQNAYVYSVRDTYTQFNARAGKNATIVDAQDLALVNGKAPYAVGNDNLISESEQHAVGYERAQYEAWVVYKQMETSIGESFTTALGETVNGLGYNCYAIVNGKTTNTGDPDVWLESNQIGYNFMQQLAGGEATHYRDHDNSFFEPIEKEILYHCAIGSTVEDYIGYDEEKGNFEFLQNADYITLSKGGEAYTTAQVETKEGATASYAFTAGGASEPTFWLDYYYGNGMTTEKFIWTFGENVSRFKPVSLTYKLQLTEKAETEGTYVMIPGSKHSVFYV